MLHGVDQPPTAVATTAAVGHRVRRHDAVALTAAGDVDHGCALVVATELSVRHEADRLRDEVAKRAVADDHAREALCRLQELEDPLLG